jgi:hypothetical protein
MTIPESVRTLVATGPLAHLTTAETYIAHCPPILEVVSNANTSRTRWRAAAS